MAYRDIQYVMKMSYSRICMHHPLESCYVVDGGVAKSPRVVSGFSRVVPGFSRGVSGFLRLVSGFPRVVSGLKLHLSISSVYVVKSN